MQSETPRGRFRSPWQRWLMENIFSSHLYADSGCGGYHFVVPDPSVAVVHFPWDNAGGCRVVRSLCRFCGSFVVWCIALRHTNKESTHGRSGWQGPILGTLLRHEKVTNPRVERVLWCPTKSPAFHPPLDFDFEDSPSGTTSRRAASKSICSPSPWGLVQSRAVGWPAFS